MILITVVKCGKIDKDINQSINQSIRFIDQVYQNKTVTLLAAKNA